MQITVEVKGSQDREADQISINDYIAIKIPDITFNAINIEQASRHSLGMSRDNDSRIPYLDNITAEPRTYTCDIPIIFTGSTLTKRKFLEKMNGLKSALIAEFNVRLVSFSLNSIVDPKFETVV